MEGQLRGLGAPAPGLAARAGPRGVGVHATRPARLDRGTPFEPLEAGDLLTLGGRRSLQLGHAAQELQHQPLQIGVRQTIKIPGWCHAAIESETPSPWNPPPAIPPGLLPLLLS